VRNRVSVLVFVVCSGLAAHAAQQPQIPTTSEEIYKAWCAKCHADDGSGRVAVPTVKVQPRDFSDCPSATPEPDADWELVTAGGGTPAGMSSEMPSYGELLRPDQIRDLVRYLRSFCTEPGWPSGNMNFPRPIFTEKAFPENEVVILPEASHQDGEATGFRLRSVYEHRIGRRAHMEIGVPLRSVDAGRRETGLGDISLAGKYVLHTNRANTAIVTAGLEVTLPTGSASRHLGSGTTVFEPYIASGVALGPTILQGQVKYEFPARHPLSEREFVYNVYVGHSLDDRPSAWTFGVELNGVQKEVAVTPQVRKALTRTGALAVAGGVRIPFINQPAQPVRFVGYLLWEYLDPVRSRP
jgi:mono/diheme cytochrome c family protein